MDLATLIGLLVGFGSLVIGYLVEGGILAGLFSPTALIIIFGGTIGAVAISFPIDDLKLIPAMLRVIFNRNDYNEVEIINTLVGYSDKARREGLLILESEAQDSNNQLIKKGLSLIVDGISHEDVKTALYNEINLKNSYYVRGSKIFQAAGGYSPTMGIIGTVMGLISVLGKGLEDTSALAKDISLAFIATLYGVFTANIVWLPFENKIKVKASKERMINEIIVEGLLSIQSGDSPNIIKEKLCLSMLEKKASRTNSEANSQLTNRGGV